MFSDPQSVTLGSDVVSLPRVSVGNMTAGYRSNDGRLQLVIAHSANKRERSVARHTLNKVGADPFDAARSKAYTTQIYTVVDSPLNGAGFTDAELEELATAHLTFLKEPGVMAKILGKES